MKKLLQGFLFGYLLFCALSAWAFTMPSSVYNGSDEWVSSGGWHLENNVWQIAYFFNGGQFSAYASTGNNTHATGSQYENPDYLVWYDFSGTVLEAGYHQTSPTSIPSPFSDSPASPPVVTNGTNIIVSANTNDGTWASVITSGVNGSTNITQISITLNDLLRDSSDNSAMKTAGGNSVFKNTSSGVSYFEEQKQDFFDLVTFQDGSLVVGDPRMGFSGNRLQTDINWDGMPAFPEFPSDISASLNWGSAPGWFADGTVNIDGSEKLGSIDTRLGTLNTTVLNMDDTMNGMFSLQQQDSSRDGLFQTAWFSAWDAFITSWGEFTYAFDNFTTGFFEKWDEVFLSGGSSVLKDGQGQSAFVDASGKSYLATLVETMGGEEEPGEYDSGTNSFDELPEMVETNYDDSIEMAARDEYDSKIEETRTALSNDMVEAYAAISNQTAMSVSYIRDMSNSFSSATDALKVSPGYITETLVVTLPNVFPHMNLPPSIELTWKQSWLGPASVLGYGLSLMAVVFGIIMGARILSEV